MTTNTSRLNYNKTVGWTAIRPGVPTLVPLTLDDWLDADQTRSPDLIPKKIRDKFLGENLYFQFSGEKDSEAILTDAYGRYRPLMLPKFVVTDDNDHVLATGWNGSDGKPFVNALSLTTLRLGAGNDTFQLTGDGITQLSRSKVSYDESSGYIFQSSIFGENGDDYVQALMPWQSTFDGGENTYYAELKLGPLLTNEEVRYGDVIELKGSRSDWDLEFRHISQDDLLPENDQAATLASYLAGKSYIVTSNNNKIFNFEKVLFADVMFDVVLFEQLESGAVYGQPDYYLNGANQPAPALNSTFVAGSRLWEAFRFNRTKLSGIAGSKARPIVVYTGDREDTPLVAGDIFYASLFTEGDHDHVEVDGLKSAKVDLGDDRDYLIATKVIENSIVRGGNGDDEIVTESIRLSQVYGDNGDDVIRVRTANGPMVETTFDGGGGSDLIYLPNSFSSYSFELNDLGGLRDSNGNHYNNFETFFFADRSAVRRDQIDAYPAGVEVTKLAQGGLMMRHSADRNSTLTGTVYNDILQSGPGSQVLDGVIGSDRLTGGLGSDVFRINIGDRVPDRITDFVSGEDKIQIYGFPTPRLREVISAAKSKGTLLATARSRLTAMSSSALFVYTPIDGKLYYNANQQQAGLGVGGLQFATLPLGTPLSIQDLLVS